MSSSGAIAYGASKLLRAFVAVGVMGSIVTGVLYVRQGQLQEQVNSQGRTALADGAITAQKLSPELADKLETAVALAGAIPVKDKDGNLTSCSKGQVVSFSNGQLVCVTLTVNADGAVSVTTAGVPGTDGADVAGLSGANGGDGTDGGTGTDGTDGGDGQAGSNGLDGVAGTDGTAGGAGADGAAGAGGATGAAGGTGATGPTGPKGDKGDKGDAGVAGVLTAMFGDGLSGTLASQVLNVDVVTDLNGGIEAGADGLTLLASCSSSQLLKWNGTAWACANDNIGAVATADLTSATDGVTVTGGVGAVLGAGTNISIATATGSQNGLLDSADWTTFNNKQNALDFIGNGMFSLVGNDVTGTSCSNNQVLLYNGSTWVCTNQVTSTTYSAGAGLSLSGTTFSFNPGTLSSVGSVAGTDELLVYSGSATRRITYNDLFNGVLGSLNYRGTWNASTDSPTLSGACTSGTKGYYYVVSTNGSTNLDGNSTWNIGDWVVCNGTAWQRVQTASGVSSVFGRGGAVTAQTGDYNAGQITNTPAGSIAASSVQGALNELDTEKLGTGLASGLVFVGNGSGQAAGVALSGDATLSNSGVVTVANGAITSAKIADGTIAFADLASNSCSNGQTIKYNGSAWVCAADSDTALAIGGLDAETKSANGAVISSGTLYLQSADGSNPGLVTAGTQTLGGAKTFSGNTTFTGSVSQTGSGTFSTGTGTVSLNGNASLAANRTLSALAGTGAFDMSLATGTFKTSTGANTLSGDTTIAANKNLAAASGTGSVDFSAASGTFKTTTGMTTVGGNLTVVGSTLLTSDTVDDLVSGGSIGSAATTVDVITSFLIDQTSTGQTLTLPTPTDTTAGRSVVVSNVGSAAFTMGGVSIEPARSAVFVWNGSVWSALGGGSGNCDPTKQTVCNGGNTLAAALTVGTTDAQALNLATNGTNRFVINGTASTMTGQGNTTLTTASNGSLTLSTNGSGAISIDSGAAGAINIGTGANAKTITMGNATGITSLAFLTGTGGTTNTSTTISGTANAFTANAVTTGTAMNITANALTNGKALNVASSSTGMTGSLAGIYLTGSNAGNTGSLLTLQSSGALSQATGISVDTSTSAGLAASFAGAIATKRGSDFSTTGVSTNVDFGNTSLVRLTGASTQTIDSIAGGSDGKILTILNAAAQAAVIRDSSTATGLAANKVKTGTGGDLTLAVDASVQLIYDSGSTVWRVVGGAGSGASTTVASCTTTANCTTALGGVWNKTLLVDTTAGNVTVNLPTAVANSGKTITVKKVSSDGNVVNIDANGTETIDGSLTTTLSSYQSSIQLISNGTNVYTTSDIGAVGGEYATVSRSTSQTMSGTANTFQDVSFDTVGASAGLTAAAGASPFTIVSSGVYELTFTSGIDENANTTSNNAQVRFMRNGVVFSTSGQFYMTGNNDGGGIAHTYQMNLTAGDVIKAQALFFSGTTNTLNSPVFTIKKLSGFVPINGQTASYFTARDTATGPASGSAVQSAITSTGVANMNTAAPTANRILITGNNAANGITQSGSVLTMTKSGTYTVTFTASIMTSGTGPTTYAQVLKNGSVMATSGAIASGGDTQPISVSYVDTFNAGDTVDFRANASNGTGSIYVMAYGVSVTQVGTTASTGVAMNTLTNAMANGALDNAGYTQTWSWNSLGSSNGLVINSTDTAATGNLFAITNSSTGAAANGLARFNFSGAHTGNGLQIDDATLTGTAVAINANSITTGKGLVVSSSSLMATTGRLVSFTQSNTSNTGTTLELGNSSNTTGLALAVSSGGVAFQKNPTDYTTTGSQNNVDLGNYSTIRLNPASNLTLTGIANPSDGKLLFLNNIHSTSLVTLANLSGSSLAGNQISAGSDLVLSPNSTALLQYDGGASKWRVISAHAALARARIALASNSSLTSSATNMTLMPLSTSVASPNYNTNTTVSTLNGGGTITITQSGWYQLTGQIEYDTAGTTQTDFVAIYANSTTPTATLSDTSASLVSIGSMSQSVSGAMTPVTSTTIYLAAGTIVALYGQSEGGGPTITAGNARTFLQVIQLPTYGRP